MEFKRPSGENSSYSLQFWGVTLDCKTANRTIAKSVAWVGNSAKLALSEVGYTGLPEVDPYTNTSIPWPDVAIYYRTDPRWREDFSSLPSILKSTSLYQYYPCINSTLGSDIEVNVLAPTLETICTPRLVRYNVTITYTRAGRMVTWTQDARQPPQSYTPWFRDFNGTFQQWTQLSDAVAMYSSFLSTFSVDRQLQGKIHLRNVTKKSLQSGSYTFPNGTTVKTCQLDFDAGAYIDKTPADWLLTPFTLRARQGTKGGLNLGFTLNQEIANEALTNFTISALALNDRRDLVPGTETRMFNVYHFQHKLVFFLPYSLLLVLTIPILILGFVALQKNGVSAISGGFLQILMTTTGRTTLEAVAAKSSLGGQENVSKELRDIEVRFGELVDVEEAGEAKETMVANAGSGDYTQNTHGDDHGTEVTSNTEEDVIQQGLLNRTSGYANVTSSSDMTVEEARVVRRAGFGSVHETRLLDKGAIS
jgi:hypothetical protein